MPKNSLSKRSQGLVFLIIFAIATMMGNIVHASFGDEFEVFGGLPQKGGFTEYHNHDHNHEHLHFHDIETVTDSDQFFHNHDHNPADHSHDFPLMTLNSFDGFQEPPSSDFLNCISSVIFENSFKIERPPRPLFTL